MQSQPVNLTSGKTQQDTLTAWQLFFPNEDLRSDDRRYELVQEVHQFLSSLGKDIVRKSQFVEHYQAYVVPLNVDDMLQRCNSPLLPDALSVHPEEAIQCINLSIYLVLFHDSPQLANELFGLNAQRCTVRSRLHSFRQSRTYIHSLTATSISRIASIRGTVVRISPIRPVINHMQFQCQSCSHIAWHSFKDSRFSYPTSCAASNCKARTFKPRYDGVKCVDWQRIRVQELIAPDKHGQLPRSIEVELNHDLVSQVMPGDIVEVTGIVKVISTDAPQVQGGRSSGKRKNLFLLYLEALSLKARGRKSHRRSKAGEAVQLQAQEHSMTTNTPPILPVVTSYVPKDFEFITEFTQRCEGDQLRILTHSLCPSIFGHELVKAGLLLALMGGVTKSAGAQGSIHLRGDIHMLMVGDPGQGKSQLLKAAVAVAPRGVYVCGNTASAAGLTVSISRDPLTGDATFEAGSLVLADRGVCCVDELDKMSADQGSLLEALEQQVVSVAKGGLVATLPAKTTVLAAANPVGGIYQRSRTVCENIKMSSALLSRFDLVFVLEDRPDAAKDAMLSHHILRVHGVGGVGAGVGMGGGEGGTQRSGVGSQFMRGSQGGSQCGVGEEGRQGSLMLKLAPIHPDDIPIPPELIKKYITYAKEYIHPVLSPEARQVLLDFYLSLRQSIPCGAGPPVTARQLESMVRLAEARARVDLRCEVSQSDAADVVSLMKSSLYDLSSEGGGGLI